MQYIEDYRTTNSKNTQNSSYIDNNITINKNNKIFPYYAIPKDIHNGTIEILNIIDNNAVSFNENNYIELLYASKSIGINSFFEKYGDDILKISQELSDLNMCYLTISWKKLIIVKKGFENFKFEYRNTFYKSLQENKEKFITDINRLYEEGFILMKYDIVYGSKDEFLGYLTTLKK